MSDEPKKPQSQNQVSSGAGIKIEMPPPAADDEFIGSKGNNPFRKNLKQNITPTNPFHNRFEPEG